MAHPLIPNLKVHQQRHCGKRKPHCSIGGKEFKNLKNHMKSHSVAKALSSPTVAESESANQAKTDVTISVELGISKTFEFEIKCQPIRRHHFCAHEIQPITAVFPFFRFQGRD